MELVTLILCISLTGFVQGIDEMYPFLEDYMSNRGEVIGCRGTRMEHNFHMMAARCMPRMSLVKLKPESDSLFLPDMVPAKRCSGMCGNNLSCMPIAGEMKPVVVKRKHLKSHETSCYRVYVEEHTKCKCKCNVMEKDCNRNQIYREDICACICTNMEEQLACIETPGMVWNTAMCKCTCAMPEEECSTGLEWIPSLCKCKRVMDSIE